MKDRISALMDGDLDEDECRPVLDSLKRQGELREHWQTYCLIGDVLRGEPVSGSDLTARVMDEVRDGPTLVAPAGARKRRRVAGLRARLMPLAASVMGVAAVGYVAFTLYPSTQQGPSPETVNSSIARGDRQAVESSAPPVARLSDPHREYVFVHQAMSGGGPIPGGVQYARSVADLGGDVRP